ncbi:hypothetical protein BTR23_13830 [Alkalihalophilus pseudofirmus]|nr:hypothetical protein BTR23_13830 [Alkalihalophilus pseudofirmus]
MVSIITCTMRSECMDNVFENYNQQTWENKELIIVLNNDGMDKKKWKEKANQFPNISVFYQPNHVTLGECFNFAVTKAKYEYIAKFDDDDYYAPKYLSEIMEAFNQTNADIVGKKSIYAYITDKKALVIREQGHEKKFTENVRDCTLVVKKEVFNNITLAHKNQRAFWEFQIECRKKGYTIYSTSKQNFVYIKRKECHHTMKWSINEFMRKCKFVKYTENYKPLIES